MPPLTLDVQHPLAMLYHVALNSQAFADLLVKAGASSPSNPFSIMFYCDEVTPGNPLAATIERKFWVFYWTVAEIGPMAMCHEDRLYYGPNFHAL